MTQLAFIFDESQGIAGGGAVAASTSDAWPLLRNGRTAAGEEPCHCGVWNLDVRNDARARTGTPTCVKSTGRGTACLTPAARVLDGATYCAAHEPPCFTLEEKA